MPNLSLLTLQLSQAQLNVLLTASKQDANVIPMIANKDTAGIASYYNAPSSPPVMLWKSNVTAKDLLQCIDWTEYTTLTTQFQNSFDTMLSVAQQSSGGGIDATLSALRTGFSTIFAGKPNTLSALTAIAQVTGTRFQTLSAFISGTGNPAVSPVYGYTLSVGDVSAAIFNADGSTR